MTATAMTHTNLWKELLGAAVLVFFAIIGVAHVVNPDRFMRPWHRGGEMLTDWNRFGIRIVGAILTAFAIYVLYNVFAVSSTR
ncbi:MAG: hypothetical protein WAN69_09150 [Candidatus Korobacteraceae bacterium]